MNSIVTTIEKNSLISSVEAGRQFGYTNDYVARLAREKKILGSRIGRQWFVDVQSFEKYVQETEAAKSAYAEKIRDERKKERVQIIKNTQSSVEVYPLLASRASVLAKSGLVLCLSLVTGSLLFLGVQNSPKENLASAPLAIFEKIKELVVLLNRPHISFKEGESQVASIGQSTKKTVLDTPQVSKSNSSAQGVVIMPLDGAHNDIQESFSDPVTIKEDVGGQSGVITPEFKNASNTTYRYLMVPIHSP